MSITTGKGDWGKTSLASGKRVWKDSDVIEVLGSIDELSSVIGVAKHHAQVKEIRPWLDEVQLLLMRVAADVACYTSSAHTPVGNPDSELLTRRIHDLEAQVELHGFVLLGECISSAQIDVARTLARRVERRMIPLWRKKTVSEDLLRTVNRLSDFLYMCARMEEKKAGCLKQV